MWEVTFSQLLTEDELTAATLPPATVSSAATAYRVNGADALPRALPPGPMAVTVAMYVPLGNDWIVFAMSTSHSAPFATAGLPRFCVWIGVAVFGSAPFVKMSRR